MISAENNVQRKHTVQIQLANGTVLTIEGSHAVTGEAPGFMVTLSPAAHGSVGVQCTPDELEQIRQAINEVRNSLPNDRRSR